MQTTINIYADPTNAKDRGRPKVSLEQAKQSRQRVVAVASFPFHKRGLHGVGVADIMAAAGLTHGGSYGHFARKDALTVEAFDAALAERHRGKLDALIANYLSLGHVNAPGRGYALAVPANDVAREPPGSPIRTCSSQAVKRLVGLLADLIRRTRAGGRNRWRTLRSRLAGSS